MAATTLHTADLAVFDQLETVRLRRRDSTQVLVLPGALRRAVGRREAQPSGGRYTAAEVRWHLPAVLLSEPPRPGCMLVDSAGETWVVLTVDRCTLGSRYVCTCRGLSIDDGLHQRVSVEQAQWYRGRFGEPRARWVPRQGELLVHIQALDAEQTIEHHQRRVRVTHRAYLAEPLALDGELRLVADSAIYRIVGQREINRLDALPVLLLERLA
jgi:hypothetical protein